MPHDHPHHHHHGPRAGDNRAPKSATQWQDPTQTPTGAEAPPIAGPPEPDFDLVETAFCEAALTAKDATSLLRLARVPFIAELEDGTKIYLLTFRVEQSVEVGSIAPGFAVDQPVYHPLPESRLRREKRAKLIYQTPDGLREYSLGDVRRLRDVTLAAETQG